MACGRYMHTYIYTQFNYVHKNLNNSSDITGMVKPFRALDSYIQPQAPTPREGAPGPILPRLGPASTRHSDAKCEIEQGEDPPQCQKRQLRAQTNSPGHGCCIGRSPTGLRSMAGEMWPAAGTYIHIICIIHNSIT